MHLRNNTASPPSLPFTNFEINDDGIDNFEFPLNSTLYDQHFNGDEINVTYTEVTMSRIISDIIIPILDILFISVSSLSYSLPETP
jgi:hypothetical protein